MLVDLQGLDGRNILRRVEIPDSLVVPPMLEYQGNYFYHEPMRDFQDNGMSAISRDPIKIYVYVHGLVFHLPKSR